MMGPLAFAETLVENNLEKSELTSNVGSEHVDFNTLDRPILLQSPRFLEVKTNTETGLGTGQRAAEMTSVDSPILLRLEKAGGDSIQQSEQDSEQLIDNPSKLYAFHLPKNNGDWTGEPGNSEWKPAEDYIPQKNNAERRTWLEILEPYNIDSIPFKDGYPDFSKVALETVEINDFTENRDSNFAQADKMLAEKYNQEAKDGRTDWKASEIRQYRKDNDLTWHECEDTKTLQLVPSEIHNNIPHEGGVAQKKQQQH